MSGTTDNEDIEYDPDSGIHRTTHDPETESPSLCILEAVAAITNREPTELEPLDQYINPDALNGIFRPTAAKAGAHGSLSFTYEGLLVTVHSDGEIELRDASY